ncbi:unnamed protein product [Cyclocybe aegerita]|uniref:Uncharacterized protein n=1 Tax=Cyclocybe aegerita TaxID=1973307 RepID=A0A8S0XVC6_CYCAE|nr:unnamed protein product [Cyclocybe aegerita]
MSQGSTFKSRPAKTSFKTRYFDVRGPNSVVGYFTILPEHCRSAVEEQFSRILSPVAAPSQRFLLFLAAAGFFGGRVDCLAPSDSWMDVDLGQSGYAGGNHNLDPAVVDSPQFGLRWKVDSNPGETHYARPLIYTPPSTNKQIVFLASTENILRTLDAETGEILRERQVTEPFNMAQPFCTMVSETLGVLGTPTIDPDTDTAYFFAKSHIPYYRDHLPTGIINGVYYFYAVDVNTLEDREGFPILVDGLPASNDPRRYFIGGIILQRPSLIKLGDVVYGAFGGGCGGFNLTGTILGIDVKQKKVVTNWVTQAGPESLFTEEWTAFHGGGPGGIWQAGQGLATDGTSIFFASLVQSNGAGSSDPVTDTTPRFGNASLSVLSEVAARVIPTADGDLKLVDFFRPYNYQHEEGMDFGSGGFQLLSPYFNTSTVSRIAAVASRSFKIYVFDLSNLGGYRQGLDGTDAVLQSIITDGEVYGGIGSYPLDGGYIYAAPTNKPVVAHRFTITDDGTPKFVFAGQSGVSSSEQRGTGIATVTSYKDEPGTGIVWVTDPVLGLRAWHAIPGEDGVLKQIELPPMNGANRYSRATFGDGKVYVVDAAGSHYSRIMTGETLSYPQPTSVNLSAWLFRVERDLKDAGIPQAQWSDAMILLLEGEMNMAMRQRRQARRDLGVEVWDWAGFCKALEEVLGDIGIRAVSLAEKYRHLLSLAGRPSFLQQLREYHPIATKVVGVGLVAVGGAALAPAIVVGGLNALGFTAAGVAGGSIAAGLQSVFYGGATTGLFSLCQSIGATAAAPTLASVLSAIRTVVAGATILVSESKDDKMALRISYWNMDGKHEPRPLHFGARAFSAAISP